ncbi:hypothetical protein TNCV_1786771 [Trichonephila clavipes]|nr:hypothetical protein TNCV_1786771 [Trichonephila clavipes]
MSPDRQRPNQGPRNSSWQRAKRRLSLAVALRTIQVTERFSSVSPLILWGNTLELVRAFPPLYFHQPHECTCGSTAI